MNYPLLSQSNLSNLKPIHSYEKGCCRPEQLTRNRALEQIRVSSLQDTNHGSVMLKYLLLITSLPLWIHQIPTSKPLKFPDKLHSCLYCTEICRERVVTHLFWYNRVVSQLSPHYYLCRNNKLVTINMLRAIPFEILRGADWKISRTSPPPILFFSPTPPTYFIFLPTAPLTFPWPPPTFYFSGQRPPCILFFPECPPPHFYF